MRTNLPKGEVAPYCTIQSTVPSGHWRPLFPQIYDGPHGCHSSSPTFICRSALEKVKCCNHCSFSFHSGALSQTLPSVYGVLDAVHHQPVNGLFHPILSRVVPRHSIWEQPNSIINSRGIDNDAQTPLHNTTTNQLCLDALLPKGSSFFLDSDRSLSPHVLYLPHLASQSDPQKAEVTTLLVKNQLHHQRRNKGRKYSWLD